MTDEEIKTASEYALNTLDSSGILNKIEEKPLTVGEVVFLKSGSPRLTIIGINSRDATVMWAPFG